jgi:hypothetical protein
MEEHCACSVCQRPATRQLHFEVGQPLDPNQGDCLELRFFAMFDGASQIGSDDEKETTYCLVLLWIIVVAILQYCDVAM